MVQIQKVQKGIWSNTSLPPLRSSYQFPFSKATNVARFLCIFLGIACIYKKCLYKYIYTHTHIHIIYKKTCNFICYTNSTYSTTLQYFDFFPFKYILEVVTRQYIKHVIILFNSCLVSYCMEITIYVVNNYVKSFPIMHSVTLNNLCVH